MKSIIPWSSVCFVTVLVQHTLTAPGAQHLHWYVAPPQFVSAPLANCSKCRISICNHPVHLTLDQMQVLDRTGRFLLALARSENFSTQDVLVCV